MRKLSVVLVALVLTANIAVAGGATTHQDTIRTKKQATYYDPIDYNAVLYNLERASQKTFAQRLYSALTQPLVQRDNIDVSSHFGVAYTQETNFAFTAAATASYKSTKTSSLTSVASLAAMVSVNGFFRVQAAGVNYFSEDDKLQYEIGGGSMPVKFWGLGYNTASSNIRTKYTRRDFNTSARYMHHFVGGLWAGAGLNLRYDKGDKFDSIGESFLSLGGQMVRSVFTTGISVSGVYDTRDNDHTTARGLYVALNYELRPKAFGNYHKTLNHFTAQIDYFTPLWQGCVMAIDAYGDLWSSDAPWLYWASIGGSERMRGYYLGRYTDRKMITAQLELRQAVWGPFGVCVWGGAGTIFDKCKEFDASKILPNGGLGVRIAAGDRTVLRVDYGFGRKSHGLIINVNEAF